MSQPWDRQPSEPGMWFDRFDRLFRPQGPSRSLLGAYNAYQVEAQKSVTKSVPRAWSDNAKSWNWRQRAEAWDEQERQERLRIEQEERRDMTRRHIQAALEMQTLARHVVKQQIKQASQKQPVDVTPAEARQMIKDGVIIERQARGLPDWLLKVTEMSDQELLQRYDELISESAGGLESGAGSLDDSAGLAEAGDTDTAEETEADSLA